MNSLWLFLSISVSVYLLICAMLYLLQERMIFFPESLPLDYDFTHGIHTAFQEVWLPHESGKAHGLLFSCSEKRRGTVLYFHGNGGAMLKWIDVASRFLQRGYDVLIMDYRGYGKSRGALSQEALLADAQAAYDYLKAQVPESEIAVFGRSLGSGFAAYIGSRNQPQKILLETPYYSIARVAARRFFWLPVRRLIRYPMPAATFLETTQCPVWLVHGTQDRVIPHQNSRDLMMQLGTERCTYVEIPGGTHNDLDTFPAYHAWLDHALT